MKKFLVVIANYNGEKFLKNCLDSLFKTRYENFDVCIIDDGSNDDSIKIINLFTAKKNIIILRQNHQGAAKARNQAIDKFRDSYEYFIFLDNDTEVDPDWIIELEKKFNEDGNIGALQCLLIDYLNRDLIQLSGVYLIPHVCWGIGIENGKKITTKNKESIYCAGISAALAVKSQVLKKIIGFDEKLAVTTEDLDFTWRIWLAGYKIKSCPNSIIFHYTKNIDMRKDMNVSLYSQYFHLNKNSIRTLIKNYQISSLLWYFPQLIIILLIRSLIIILKRKDASSLKAFYNSITWNINNLKDTLKQRNLVQTSRVFSDKYIYKYVMVKSSLYEIYSKYFKK